jgi:hypothetical protein
LWEWQVLLFELGYGGGGTGLEGHDRSEGRTGEQTVYSSPLIIGREALALFPSRLLVVLN